MQGTIRLCLEVKTSGWQTVLTGNDFYTYIYCKKRIRTSRKLKYSGASSKQVTTSHVVCVLQSPSMRVHSTATAAALLLGAFIQPLWAVKENDFRKCSQAAFCRRGRALSARASESSSWSSPYYIDASTLQFTESRNTFTAAVKSELYPSIKFQLQVLVQADGVARIRMDEVGGLRKRYDEAASWALISEPVLAPAGQATWSDIGKTGIKGAFSGVELVINYAPLKVTLLRAGREEMVLNGRGLLHMEHFRSQEIKEVVVEGEGGGEQTVLEAPVKPSAWFEGEEEDGYWDESFSSWTDTKPKGIFSCFPRFLLHNLGDF